MHARKFGCVALALALLANSASGQQWHSQGSASDEVTLGRPRPLSSAGATPAFIPVASLSTPRPIVRAQSPDMPAVNVPPPPPPGGPAVFPGGPGLGRPGEEAYNCGIVNNNADQGNFFTRTGEKFRRCWGDTSDAVRGAYSNRTLFQSDHEFDCFISPVSNPVYFEDPRALTEFRPVFMWQRTRDSNPVYAGGDNFFLLLQGRLAITPNISFVVNKFGWTFNNPEFPIPGIEDANGFSELHLGPKFTVIRNDTTGTLFAFGANFEIATGSSRVAQDTGDWSVSPYFSFAQNFWRTSYGSFNFMNTTGYSFGVDSQRSDFLYSSFHLDYNFQQWPKFYPLVELNWTYYTDNGGARPINFEGNNLYNFGATDISGHSDLSLALGMRYKFSENVQVGVVGEFPLIGGDRTLDRFRLTADLILRY